MWTLPYPEDNPAHLPRLFSPASRLTQASNHPPSENFPRTLVENGPDQFVWPEEAMAWGKAPVYEVSILLIILMADYFQDNGRGMCGDRVILNSGNRMQSFAFE